MTLRFLRLAVRCGLLAAAAILCLGPPRTATAAEVTLFAAASTTEAAEAVAAEAARAGLGPVRVVVAASSTLARQIEQGAPADLFLSANVAWMDYLEDRGLLAPQSRVALLGNALVLVTEAGNPLELRLGGPDGTDLAQALGVQRVALGDPSHVPAGIYAKAALESLGLWRDLAPKVAFGGSVRAALALVQRGEAAAGIVYATDARLAPDLKIAGVFASESHPPIVYPLAVVAGRDRPEVAAVYRYLKGPQAAAIFRDHGFTVAADAAG